MVSHSNKKKKKKKRKLKDLTIKQLLGEHSFYKQPMKKPKRKRKKITNLEFLQVLPFHDNVGIFLKKTAHKKWLASYHVKCIAKNSLRDSLFSNKEKDKKVIY